MHVPGGLEICRECTARVDVKCTCCLVCSAYYFLCLTHDSCPCSFPRGTGAGTNGHVPWVYCLSPFDYIERGFRLSDAGAFVPRDYPGILMMCAVSSKKPLSDHVHLYAFQWVVTILPVHHSVKILRDPFPSRTSVLLSFNADHHHIPSRNLYRCS